MVKRNGNVITISNMNINYLSGLTVALNTDGIKSIILKNNRIFSESISNQLAKTLLDLGFKKYLQDKLPLLTREEEKALKISETSKIIKRQETYIASKFPIDLGPMISQFFELVKSVQDGLKVDKNFNVEGAIIPFLDKIRSAGVSTIGWNKRFYNPDTITVNDIKKLSIIGELSIVINETLTINYLFNSESARKDYNDLIKILDTKKNSKS